MDIMSDLSSWLDEWLLELEAGKPGDATIKVYARSVRQFLAWLAEAHPEVTDPADLDRTHARDWIRSLMQAGKADATRRVRGIALRKWLGYVASQPDSGMSGNPATDLELPMPEAPPVPIVTEGTMAALLKSTTNNTFVDRRDAAILRLLFDAGVRRAELVQIDMSDLDLEHQQVLVHGKGGKIRIVPFSGKTALAFRKYLRARAKHKAAGQAALFLSSRPDGRGDWRLRGGGVGEMLWRRCDMAGVERLHPHQFRHGWAADLKAQGLSEDYLERLGGWAKGSIMTRRYGNAVADQHARDAARRLARGDRV